METAIVLTGLLVPLLAASAYYVEDYRAAALRQPAGDGPVEATMPRLPVVDPEQ